MPSGLSKAKTKINRLFRNKSTQQEESQSSSNPIDDQNTKPKPSASATDSTSLSPTSPSGAPQLAHPNISSTKVHEQKDGADDSEDEEEDMTAAVLSAGNQVRSESQSQDEGYEHALGENESPSRPMGENKPLIVVAEEQSKSIPPASSVKPKIAKTDEDKSQREAGLEKESDTVASASVIPREAEHTRKVSRSSELSASEPRRPTDAEQTQQQHASTSRDTEQAPSEAPPTTTTSTGLEPSNTGHVSADSAQSEPSHSEPLTAGSSARPTDQEIEDVERREAKAAVEASKAPGPDSDAKPDLAASKGTGDVIKSVAANAGAAGQSMGMSATSGPMEDMPAA